MKHNDIPKRFKKTFKRGKAKGDPKFSNVKAIKEPPVKVKLSSTPDGQSAEITRRFRATKLGRKGKPKTALVKELKNILRSKEKKKASVFQGQRKRVARLKSTERLRNVRTLGFNQPSVAP